MLAAYLVIFTCLRKLVCYLINFSHFLKCSVMWKSSNEIKQIFSNFSRRRRNCSSQQLNLANLFVNQAWLQRHPFSRRVWQIKSSFVLCILPFCQITRWHLWGLMFEKTCGTCNSHWGFEKYPLTIKWCFASLQLTHAQGFREFLLNMKPKPNRLLRIFIEHY